MLFQLNMVCDRAIQIPNVQMIFFFGVLTGSLFFGQVSDMLVNLITTSNL